MLRNSGEHADVMRLADLRDVHPVIIDYLFDERDPDGTAETRTHTYYFNIRIGMDLPLMQRAEFIAIGRSVRGGNDTRKRPGGYGPEGQTTMSEPDKREYEWFLDECQRLAQAFTGQAGPPELRVLEYLPSQDRGYSDSPIAQVGRLFPKDR